MNTLELTASPATADNSGSGEQPAHIFVKIKQANLDTELLRKNPDMVAVWGVIYGSMLQNRLDASLLEGGIPGAKISTAGVMDTALTLISLERTFAPAAIAVIRQILRDTKVEATSSIHWLRDPDEPFRIAHYGDKLGPPVTMTLADALAEQEALYQKARALYLKRLHQRE